MNSPLRSVTVPIFVADTDTSLSEVHQLKAAKAATPNLNLIKGKVTDEKGEPIIGANIVVKGTTNGTITGVDGDYSLKAPVGSVLEISFIGYKTVTVKAVAGLQKIRLQEDSSLLDEVVVVGYGTQKKSELVGCCRCNLFRSFGR